MARLDATFLALAAAYLVVGMFFGMGMGMAQSFAYVSVHAHINLVGWTSHGIFGLAYRSWPELAQSRLAIAHFWLFVPSALLFMLGVYLTASADSHALVAHALLSLAALGLVLGTSIFCVMAWRMRGEPG
ncbi:hypothetical protein SAMN05444161_4860 [Rhizobiales bacterium GAS191]|nr:hypothetical protein SAMN05444161_4860 [Rhizobiales bacterium GAS191]